MEHQGFDPTGKYPAHQLYAQSLAGETVVKRMLVARPLDVQRLDKPAMLPGAQAQRERPIWLVDRGPAGSHGAQACPRRVREIISDRAWARRVPSDGHIGFQTLTNFTAA